MFGNRESLKSSLLLKLREVARVSKLDAAFFDEHLQVLLDSVELVEDRRRYADIKEELRDAVETAQRLLLEDLPRIRKYTDLPGNSRLTREETEDFQSLLEVWENESPRVLDQFKTAARDLIGQLSKGESLSNRSMLRNASFQEREMRARLASEGYLMLKKFQAQLNMAEGWVYSAPSTGVGSVQSVKRFIRDLEEVIRILTKTRILKGVGGAGYFINTLTFMSGADLLRVAYLERRLNTPENYYNLSTYQAEDLQEAETSAQRRVERMDLVVDVLKNSGLKAANFVTLGAAAPVLKAAGFLLRGIGASARFASNLPSYLSTVSSKIGDLGLLARQNVAYRGASAAARKLVRMPAAISSGARNLRGFGFDARRKLGSMKASLRAASQAFRERKGIREKFGLASSRVSSFFKAPQSLGDLMARSLDRNQVGAMGEPLANRDLEDLLDEKTPPTLLDAGSSSLPPDESGSMDRGTRTSPSAVTEDKRQSSGSVALSDRISQQIEELSQLMNFRFDRTDALLFLLNGKAQRSGSAPSAPLLLETASRANSATDVDFRESEASEERKKRFADENRSLFRRQVKALEKIFLLKSSPRKVADSLTSLTATAKALLAGLGTLGILESLKGLSGVFSAEALKGLLTSTLPKILTSSVSTVINSALFKSALIIGIGGFVVDALAGMLGIGRNADGTPKKVDKKQDAENWSKMTFGEKIQSGLARGIEKSGRFLFMDNLANEAASQRIQNESAYLANRPVPSARNARRPLPAVPISKPTSVIRVDQPGRSLPQSSYSDMPRESTFSTGSSLEALGATNAAGKLFTVLPGVNMDLDPATMSNFQSMAAEYRANGGKHPIVVTSGRRSSREQAALYAKDPTKAARPGFSDHERGLGIDIDRRAAGEMEQMGLLRKYGFSRPVSSEPWHLTSAKRGSLYVGDQPHSDAQSPKHLRVSDVASRSPSKTVAEIASPPAVTSPAVTAVKAATLPKPKLSVPTAAGQPTSSTSVIRQPVTGTKPGVGLSQVPTYSYLDGGFFMLNVGVLTK